MNYPSCYCFCFHLYLHLPTGIGWLHTIKHESQAQAKSPAADWTGAALGFCGWERIYLMSIRSILCQDRSRAGNECILMGTARVKMVWFFMVEHVRPPCVYSYWGCVFQRTFCFSEALRCWWKVNNWRNSATFVHSEWCPVLQIVLWFSTGFLMELHRAGVRQGGRIQPCQVHNGFSMWHSGCASRFGAQLCLVLQRYGDTLLPSRN